MTKSSEALSAVIRLGRYLLEESGKNQVLTGTQLIACEALASQWHQGNYAIGDICVYDNQLYRCVQAHNSEGNPGWSPDKVPALFAAYHTTNPDRAKTYVSPTGAHDAYAIEECVEWKGKIYRCLVHATVHDPDTLPSSWEEIS